MTVKVSGTAVAQIVIYRTRSGNLHAITHGVGRESETGVNGGVVWSQTGDAAPILETGERRAQLLLAAEPDRHWRQLYKSAETVGTETVEDKPCYVLEVVTFAGEPHTLWYDQKTGLQLREVAPLPTGGKLEMTTPEYFEADGIKMPRVLHYRTNDEEFTMVVDEIKFNQPIPDSIFALPPAIERLREDQDDGDALALTFARPVSVPRPPVEEQPVYIGKWS